MDRGKSNIIRIAMYVPLHYPFIRRQLDTVFGKYLPKKGIWTTIIAPSELGRKKNVNFTKNGLNYHIFPFFFMKGGFSSALHRMILFIHSLIGSGQYDIFQVRNSLIFGLLGMYLRRKFGIPFCFQYSYPLSLHWMENESNIFLRKVLGPLRFRLELCLMKKADIVFPISEWMREFLIKYRVPKERIFAFPLGFDRSSYDSLNNTDQIFEKYNFKKGKFTFVYIGTLIKERGVGTIINAIAETRKVKDISEAQFLFCGEGKDLNNLKETVRMLNLDNNINFTGFLDPKEIPKILKVSDVGFCIIPVNLVFQLSSPTKLYEYLAAGIPIIASKIPENIMLIKNSGGGLLIDMDVHSIKSAILVFLNKKLDAQKMGKNGKKFIFRKHSYLIRSKRMEKIYRYLMERSRNPNLIG